MVLFEMTPTTVPAVEEYLKSDVNCGSETEPSLANPAEGNPISHSQLIEISRFLKSQARPMEQNGQQPLPTHLSELLRGSKLYQAPPPPKEEKTSEYKTLMARLRREEEARSYERMMNPPPPRETFAQRFPSTKFPTSKDDNEEEMTYADVNRQLALIFNVLLSIVACAAAIWMVARRWSVPLRLALSMAGSAVVAVAEVVLYLGYLRRLEKAKQKERARGEVKTVADTWVIEPTKKGGGKEKGGMETEAERIASKLDIGGEKDGLRRRI